MKKNNSEIIDELKMLIDTNIAPLIDGDYVLWDLPYHENIGDTLIWQGTLDFLSLQGYNMIDYGSKETASFNKVKEDTIICLQGGGNWGDIYRSSQKFRNYVINEFPNNKILVFPQSIHYEDDKYLKIDREAISYHKDLYICVRDKNSYTIALKNFTNAKVLLVPDMAFYMKGVDLCKNTMVYNKSLFLKRRDIELSDKSYDDLFIDEKLEISDWPTFERKYLYWFILRILVKLTKENPIKEIDFFMRNVTNKFAYCVHRPYLINKGISFLMKYNKIYTTRLHVGILGVLLSKNVFFLDNSYGKLGGFYKCWLRNSEKISYKS